MRTIKFRGKRIDNGEWVYGYFVGTTDNVAIIIPFEKVNYDIGYIGESECCYCLPETIGQFTGLYDKNGNEIYEGDIVEWVFFYERLGANMGVIEDDTIVKGIIRWGQGGFILEVIENDFEDAGWYGISELNSDTECDVSVIGNIHDNSEL